MTDMSWLYWLTFSGLSAAGHTATPPLVLHSDGCVLPDHARLEGAGLERGRPGGFHGLPDHGDRAMAAIGPRLEHAPCGWRRLG